MVRGAEAQGTDGLSCCVSAWKGGRACTPAANPGAQTSGTPTRTPGQSWRTSGLFSQGGTAPEETGTLDTGREAPRDSPIIPCWSGFEMDSQPEILSCRLSGCWLKAVRNGNAFAVTKMGP